MLAAPALGVFGTGSPLPDLVMGAIKALLALAAGQSVMRQAWPELAQIAQRSRPETPQTAGIPRAD